MNLTANIGLWLAAFFPIGLLLLLMLHFQWSAAKAAPLGLLAAIGTALLCFRAPLPLIAMESAKGLWSALGILIVIWPAILLYEVTYQANAMAVFQKGIQKLSPNELLQVITIGWVFSSFLQGVTGFGVPVAVCAPLLMGVGVAPLWAVIVPLLGHAWGGTFGTLAVAWNSLALQTGLTENAAMGSETAFYATLFIWLFNFIAGMAICWFYGRGAALKMGLPAVLALCTVQGGGQMLIARFNQTLACFLPACLSLAVLFLLAKTKRYRTPWRLEKSPMMVRSCPLPVEWPNGRETESSQEAHKGGNQRIAEPMRNVGPPITLAQAFFPYTVLTVVTLTVLLIKPLNLWLGQWKLGFAFPAMVTGYGYESPATALYSPIAPLTHAGLFLLLASIAGFLYFRKKGRISAGTGRELLRRSLGKTLPSALAVTGFLMLSRVMSGSGQILTLAQGISAFLGGFYALVAPTVGMLGSFMTSSTMASNILFGEFQLATAKLLSLNPAAILGAQTAGGSVGNMISPGSIILGATTAGLLGKEGLILRKLLPVALMTTILMGILLFLLFLL